MRPLPCRPLRLPTRQRGSVLITAMLIATVLGVALVGYLMLSKSSLKLAHRTLFVNDASNLAEAGLEDALYSFNQVNAGTTTATAWSGWTISGSTARRTLPQFNRNQSGVGTVKVFVNDYNGGGNSYVISQATITPFDGGAPIVRVMRIGMKQSGLFINGLVALNGLSLKGQPFIDSFNSNPTNSPTGPWLPYSTALSSANTTVIVMGGTVDLGNGNIKGNLALAAGVAPPPASQVSGSIQSNFSGTFQMPAYPTAAGVSKSYSLGGTVPALLPVAGHTPASDGRYYYFTNGAAIKNTTIVTGTNVTIVGTNTSLSSGVTVSNAATLAVYMDGVIDADSKGSLNNSNWAGALQIYTTTINECKISGNGELRASLFAPNAAMKASGGGSSGALVGAFVVKSMTATGKMSFHYDEALKLLSTAGGGSRWSVNSWSEVRLESDLSALSSSTGNFLP